MAEEPDREHGRILIVEDEYAVALDLKHTLEDHGYAVVGPVGSVDSAMSIIQREADNIAAGLLDINLQGERVFPAADALLALGVPIAFLTGYGAQMLPAAYANMTRYEKPTDKTQVLGWLAEHAGPRQ